MTRFLTLFLTCLTQATPFLFSWVASDSLLRPPSFSESRKSFLEAKIDAPMWKGQTFSDLHQHKSHTFFFSCYFSSP